LEQENEIRDSLQNLSISLAQMLSRENELSQLRQELDVIEVEYKHFEECYVR
jgi:hypothetical protein